MLRSENTIDLSKAILIAQSKFPIVGKTKVNSFYKGSKYASYDDVYAGVKPILCDAGLIVEHEHSMKFSEVDAIVTIKQTVLETGEMLEKDGGMQVQAIAEVTVSTTIIHAESGQFKTIVSTTFPDKVNMHGTMAAVTYLKRYNLTSILDIAVGDEDDDGNSGLNPPEEQYGRNNARGKQPLPPKKTLPPKQQAGLTARNTVQAAEQIKNLSEVAPGELETNPGDLPFENDPPPTNGATTAPDRPMTDKERKRLGKVDKDQVESLKAILEKKGVNKDKWKSWLFAEYSFNSVTDITDDVYDAICRTVKEHPEEIMNTGGEK